MNFKKYHVSRNLFDLATAEDTNIYITNNGGETEATNGDRFIAQQFMVSPSTRYTFSWADTILGTENNSPYIRVSEYNGGSFLKRTLYLCSDYPNKVITIVSSSSTNTFDIRYDSPTSNRGQTITKLMVNTGSTALPYEPYSSEVWHDTPHYIHKTSTDTITTLPVDVYADGNNATVGLKGNTVQNGTPTPDNPIMPQGCGERTGNLAYGRIDGVNIDANGTIGILSGFDIAIGRVESGVTYTANTYVFAFYTNEPTIGSASYDGSRIVGTVGTPSTFTAPITGYVAFRLNPGEQAMLNTGSTAKPFEPNGYKIPISSANTTTPIYLGEMESTRRVKKQAVTISRIIESETPNIKIAVVALDTSLASPRTALSTILPYHPYGNASTPETFYYINANNIGMVGAVGDTDEQITAKYEGSILYYGITETTGIVNEPLMRIGDYVDKVSGITIPTIAGGDTISVDTMVPPSEITVDYKGWHPIQSVHEYDSNYTIATMQALTIAQLQTHTISDLQGEEWS